MYIPPGFTVIACEPISEEAFRAWAVDNGGVWHSARQGHHGSQPATAVWNFGSYRDMEAKPETPAEKDDAEWMPRELMHKPPQSLIAAELSEGLRDGDTQCHAVLHSLSDQWDSYAYDLGFHDWVSALLRDLLPTERIIRYEPLPPGPPTPWIWVNGKYTKNEAYHDNHNADEARDENQL